MSDSNDNKREKEDEKMSSTNGQKKILKDKNKKKRSQTVLSYMGTTIGSGFSSMSSNSSKSSPSTKNSISHDSGLVKFPDYGNALRGGTNLFPDYIVPEENEKNGNKANKKIRGRKPRNAYERTGSFFDEEYLLKKKKFGQHKQISIFDENDHNFMMIASESNQDLSQSDMKYSPSTMSLNSEGHIPHSDVDENSTSYSISYSDEMDLEDSLWEDIDGYSSAEDTNIILDLYYTDEDGGSDNDKGDEFTLIPSIDLLPNITRSMGSPLSRFNNSADESYAIQWVPDKLSGVPDKFCERCYQCGQEFTVIRRRHHCRFCGQVFCSSCSQFNIDGRKFAALLNINKVDQSLRCCKICHEQIEDFIYKKSLEDETYEMDKQERKRLRKLLNLRKRNVLEKNRPDKKYEAELDNEENMSSRVTFDSKHYSISKIATFRNNTPTTMDKITDENNGEKSIENDNIMKDSSNHSGPNSLSMKTTKANKEKKYATTNIHHIPKILTMSVDEIYNIAMGIEKEPLAQKKAYEHTLKKLSSWHWERIVQQLVSECSHISDENKEMWIKIILKLVKKVEATVSPGCRNPFTKHTQKGEEFLESHIKGRNKSGYKEHGPMMGGTWEQIDISPYVKIKIIPGGDAQSECAYVDGVVFRRTVSHKDMFHPVLKPKIILLSGGIDFNREPGKLTSLGMLVKQERPYMEILVRKILSLKPDLLFSGKSICSHASELFRSQGVVVVQNVKQNTLRSISRMCGAKILEKTDHIVNIYGKTVLGTCDSFNIKTFYKNQKRTSEGNRLKQNFQESRSVSMQNMDNLSPSDDNTSNSESEYDSEDSYSTSLPQSNENEEPGNEEIQEEIELKYGRGRDTQEFMHNIMPVPPLKVSDVFRTASSGLTMELSRFMDQYPPPISLTKKVKRRTLVCLRGCPKQLGCTLILRGAKYKILQEIKKIIVFAIHASYNLRLERKFLMARYAYFPRENLPLYLQEVMTKYDFPNEGKKISNSGEEDRLPSVENNDEGFDSMINRRSNKKDSIEDKQKEILLSTSLLLNKFKEFETEYHGEIVLLPADLYHHNSLLISSYLNHLNIRGKDDKERKDDLPNKGARHKDYFVETHCRPPTHSRLYYYGEGNDSTFGTHVDRLLHPNWTCNKCQRSVPEHVSYLLHDTGKIRISFQRLNKSIYELLSLNQHHLLMKGSQSIAEEQTDIFTINVNNPQIDLFHEYKADSIYMCSFCKDCNKIVTPITELTPEIERYSFGKVLEQFFHNSLARCRYSAGCNHVIQTSHTLWLTKGEMAMTMDYEAIIPYRLVVHRMGTLFVPFDRIFHLEMINRLYVKAIDQSLLVMGKFIEKVLETKTELEEFEARIHQHHLREDVKSSMHEVKLSLTSLKKLIGAEVIESKSLEFLKEKLIVVENRIKHCKEQKEKLASLMKKDSWDDQQKRNVQRLSFIGDSSLTETSSETEDDNVQTDSNIILSEEKMKSSDTKDNKIIQDPARTDLVNILSMEDSTNLSELSEQSNIDFHGPNDMNSKELEDNYANEEDDFDLYKYPTLILRELYLKGCDWNNALKEIRLMYIRLIQLQKEEEKQWLKEFGSDAVNENKLDKEDVGQLSDMFLGVNETSESTANKTTDDASKDSPQIEKTEEISALKTTSTVSTQAEGQDDSSVNKNTLSPKLSSQVTFNTSPVSNTEKESQSQSTPPRPIMARPTSKHHSSALNIGGTSRALTLVKNVFTSVGFANDTLTVKEYGLDLDELLPGHFSLDPGRNGAVTAVHEDSATSIISYALNSFQYRDTFYQQCQKALNIPEGDAQMPKGIDIHELLRSDLESNITIKFQESDSDEVNYSKFLCQIFYATQFFALRTHVLSEDTDDSHFLRSITSAEEWNATGGKSGATFQLTADSRFIIKQITGNEMRMFMNCATDYFNYMADSLFMGKPSALCQILGLYEVGSDSRRLGKERRKGYYIVMPNVFHKKDINCQYDLKGSKVKRYVNIEEEEEEEESTRNIDNDKDNIVAKNDLMKNMSEKQDNEVINSTSSNIHTGNGKGDTTSPKVDENLTGGDVKKVQKALKTLLDENLVERINGHPIPVQIHDHFYFFNAIQNDLDFLCKNKFVDYSMLLGVDENKNLLVIGIIDYIHQYDISKMAESTFKKVTGQEDPTVVPPDKYQQRFKKAMDRYFMFVPDKLSVLPSEG